MHQYRFIVARAGFVLLFLGITFIQVLSFPGQFAHLGKTHGFSLAFEVALTLVVGLWAVVRTDRINSFVEDRRGDER